MRYRMDLGGADAPPRRSSGRRGWTAAVALLTVGGVAGGWAAAVHGAPEPAGAAAPGVARGFVGTAVAAPVQGLPPVVAVEPEPPAPVVEEKAEAPAFAIAAEHRMTSTAYCLKGKTRTGIRTRDGVVAADPEVLPLGSVVRLSFPDGRPLGVFVVMDTGGAVRGKKVDIYMESCAEARRWGVKKVVAEVLELGRSAP